MFGIGVFNVSQRVLVEYHPHAFWDLVEVEAFVSSGIDTVGSPAATKGVGLSRDIARLATRRGFAKVVTIVGNLQHLDMLGYAELADAAISVYVASIPVLKGALFGVVGRTGLDMRWVSKLGAY